MDYSLASGLGILWVVIVIIFLVLLYFSIMLPINVARMRKNSDLLVQKMDLLISDLSSLKKDMLQKL